VPLQKKVLGVVFPRELSVEKEDEEEGKESARNRRREAHARAPRQKLRWRRRGRGCKNKDEKKAAGKRGIKENEIGEVSLGREDSHFVCQ